MAWIQPFLNWVAGMIPTKDDFNRIEGNTQYLKDEIDTQTADLAGDLNAHKIAADPHTQYTLDSEYNAHVGFGATESAKGHIEIATQAEVTAGTDTIRAVVPKYLKTELDKKAGKPASAITNNIAVFNANRDIIDGGKKLSDLAVSGSAIKVISGEYSGSGAVIRNINVGLKPAHVILVYTIDTRDYIAEIFSSFNTDKFLIISSNYFELRVGNASGSDIRLTDTGFKVGNPSYELDWFLNKTGINYKYYAYA